MILNTEHFGALAIEESWSIEFPQGLPGFEACRRFAALEHPARTGLIFLQSLERPDLCFLALPVKALRQDYELTISTEDREVLGMDAAEMPVLGHDVAALAVLSFVEGEQPTANLLAPIVVHVNTRRAVQAIRTDGRYQLREAVVVMEPVCS